MLPCHPSVTCRGCQARGQVAMTNGQPGLAVHWWPRSVHWVWSARTTDPLPFAIGAAARLKIMTATEVSMWPRRTPVVWEPHLPVPSYTQLSAPTS